MLSRIMRHARSFLNRPTKEKPAGAGAREMQCFGADAMKHVVGGIIAVMDQRQAKALPYVEQKVLIA